MDEKKWNAMSKSEQDAMMQECFAYDDVLRKNRHFVGGEALQSVRATKTLRWHGGKVMVTDGPFAETKEQLGGLLVLEAKDMNEADRGTMIRGMVDRLATRLKQNGHDVEGWLRLMRAYMVMGERDKALNALTEARQAVAGDAERLRQLNEGLKNLGLDG